MSSFFLKKKDRIFSQPKEREKEERKNWLNNPDLNTNSTLKNGDWKSQDPYGPQSHILAEI